ncbi:unnamed protein product [Darwinula stevensoni]|uniref:Uncharacterized protein n=1 Tax=Darwinula stevensoni TaxID=69355 RepID=A0A7R9AGI5_9CRUS|nr:unnamed protein product [Darwinula stevensoni]CAG0904354.1 unnamed protein product [Darwinula stevensoni]
MYESWNSTYIRICKFFVKLLPLEGWLIICIIIIVKNVRKGNDQEGKVSGTIGKPPRIDSRTSNSLRVGGEVHVNVYYSGSVQLNPDVPFIGSPSLGMEFDGVEVDLRTRIDSTTGEIALTDFQIPKLKYSVPIWTTLYLSALAATLAVTCPPLAAILFVIFQILFSGDSQRLIRSKVQEKTKEHLKSALHHINLHDYL